MVPLHGMGSATGHPADVTVNGDALDSSVSVRTVNATEPAEAGTANCAVREVAETKVVGISA